MAENESAIQPSGPSTQEGRSDWLSIVKIYAQETSEQELNLKNCKFTGDELKTLIESLPDTNITQLVLPYSFDLKSSDVTSELCKALVKTKLKKLNLKYCRISIKRLLQIMSFLKDTEITHFNVVPDDSFSQHQRDRFISHLMDSHITSLNFDFDYFLTMRAGGLAPLLHVLPDTNLTRLCLPCSSDDTDPKLTNDELISLFSNLHRTALTELSLDYVKFEKEVLRALSRSLGNSKLVKLELSYFEIEDGDVDILVDGLVQSKISDLTFSFGEVSGLNILIDRLKDTCLTDLKLSHMNRRPHGVELFMAPGCLKSSHLLSLHVDSSRLGEALSEQLMEELKFSKITRLKYADSSYSLPTKTISEFANNVKFTNLTYVDFYGNTFPPEALLIFGDCLKESKVKSINFFGCFRDLADDDVAVFIEKTKGSFVDSLNLGAWGLSHVQIEKLAISLASTTFTRLYLNQNGIGDEVKHLAGALRYSAVSHLSLGYNGISDLGAEALAKCLKDTPIIELSLDGNQITNRGAKALSLALKHSRLLNLSLSNDRITDEDFEALAIHTKDTFITELDTNKCGVINLAVEKTLWENRVKVHRLVRRFQAAFQGLLGFHLDANGSNVNSHLENRLQRYKRVLEILENPQAMNVLLHEKRLSLSEEQISSQLDEFPFLFCHYVATEVEATVMQFIGILQKAEDLELTKVVELLLFYRPLFLIDEDEGILHPSVYILLHKYKQPLCSLALDPQCEVKIIEYFIKNPNVDGGLNVIRLLQKRLHHK